MLPESHFLLGGVLSSVLAVVGTVLNLLAMMVLVDVRLRSNPTTILVIFLTITNTIYTALVLPFNSATLLNRAYFSNHNLQCKIFAFIFYLNQVRAVEQSDDDFYSKACKILLDVLMMATATVNHHIGNDYIMVDSFLISDSEDSVGGRLGRQSLGHSVHGEVQAKMMQIMTVCL